jgi:hypothetical protein
MTASLSQHRIHLAQAVGSYAAQSPDPAGTPRPPGAAFTKIELPVGVSFLRVEPDAGPQLVAGEPDETLQRDCFVIEPVCIDHQPQALLISPPGRRARVSGQISPPVVLLREKHALMLGEHLLYVTVYRRPYIGPPPVEVVGKECPFCRTTILADSRVYLCDCGVALHREVADSAKPDKKPLECATLVSECPACDRPVVRTERYDWLPDSD